MRQHALLSASSAHRWLVCPPSAVAAEAYEDQTSEFAAEGTLAHEVAEFIAGNHFEVEPHDRWVQDVRNYLNNQDITKEMVEHATTYHEYIMEQIKGPAHSMLTEQRVDFSAWVPDGFGTCDCILIEGDTLTIIDYKYGKGVAVSAENNPQMRLYALGALNDFGLAYDVTTVCTHIYQPRIGNISTETLTVEDLLTWGEKEVKPIAQKAAKGKGTYKAGAHCTFCPHAGRCRALNKACKEYVETHGLRVGIPILAPHEVAEVLEMEPLISLWLKRVKAQAMTSMLDGQDVPGFKVVEGKLGNRKWTDELQVAKVLETEGYSAEDYTETKLLSPAGIDKLVGKKKAAELLVGLTEREAGKPTIAPATDKRPVYNRLAEAQEDFK